MLTRREFTTLALSSLAWPKLLAQTANSAGGVKTRRADLQLPRT